MDQHFITNEYYLQRVLVQPSISRLGVCAHSVASIISNSTDWKFESPPGWPPTNRQASGSSDCREEQCANHHHLRKHADAKAKHYGRLKQRISCDCNTFKFSQDWCCWRVSWALTHLAFQSLLLSSPGFTHRPLILLDVKRTVTRLGKFTRTTIYRCTEW